MKFILIEIVRGFIWVLIVYAISFIVEKVTGLGLLIWNLRQKKNRLMAHGAADIAAIVYFIINLIVLHLDMQKLETTPEGYSFIKWLLLVIPVTIIFRMIHFKLTPIDPDRDDFDFSD